MIAAPPCANCEHYTSRGRCAAYPAAIPVDIIRGGADHDTARGDEVGGKTFKLDPARSEQDDARRKLAALMATS